MLSKQILQKTINIGVFVIIVTMPVSFIFEIFSQENSLRPLIMANFSIADFLIGVVFTIWLLKILIYREIKAIKLPPASVWVFICAVILSGVSAFTIKEWLKETVQLTCYFLVFYVVLINNMQTQKQKKNMIDIWFGLTTFIVLVAMYQHFVLRGSPYLIRSLFENRNILGIYLALVIPLMYGDLLFTESLFRKIWLCSTIVLSSLVIFSGGALIALIVSFGIMSLLKGKKTFAVFCTILLCLAAVYPFFLPQRNVRTIKEFVSIYEQRDINQNYNRIRTILYDLKKSMLFEKIIGPNRLVITNNVFMSSTLPNTRTNRKKYANMSGQRHVKQRFLEWQAALNMLEKNPLLGVGVGNYQNHIGYHYNEVPKVNTAEPNLHNGYLVVVSTMGLLGLASFLWILISCTKSSFGMFKSSDRSFYSGLSLGLFGSLISGAVVNVFSSILVSGILVIFIWIMCSCRFLSEDLQSIQLFLRSQSITAANQRKNVNRRAANVFVVVAILSMCFVLWASVEHGGIKEYIWIEAEDAEKVTYPLEVFEAEGASNSKAIVSRGRSHIVEGYASYPLDVSHTGDYRFWARCFWPGECSNQFLVLMDNSKRFFFGKNSVRNRWHWIKGPRFMLKKGKHTLNIWNEEFDARLDKMLITADPYYMPKGYGSKNNCNVNFESGTTSLFFPENAQRWSIRQDQDPEDVSLLLRMSDLRNPINLIAMLQEVDGIVHKHFRFPLSPKVKNLIDKYDGSHFPSEALCKELVEEINNMLQDCFLYHPQFELKAQLPGNILDMIKENPRGKELIRLNRLILEEVFTEEIAKSPGNNFAYYLSASQRPTQEYSLINIYSPKDFVFKCSIMHGKLNIRNRDVKILFNFKDDMNYYYANLLDQRIEIFIINSGIKRKIASSSEFKLFEKDIYSNFTIIRNSSLITIKHNDRHILSVVDSCFLEGKVGVGSDLGDIYFDNIEIFKIPRPEFQNNFHLNNWRNRQNWQMHHGYWHICRDRLRSLLGQRVNHHNALAVVGEDYWNNYSVRVAIKASTNGGFGLCFYYQDDKNYYLFKWITAKSQNKEYGLKQLIKVENGVETILAKKPGDFRKDCWCKLEIRLLNGNIYIYVDDYLELKCNDHTYNEGKIGLWTNSDQDVSFDCLKLEPTNALTVKKPGNYEYHFSSLEEAAIDICDWDFPSGKMIGIPLSGSIENTVWDKELFEELSMLHKKDFNGDVSVTIAIKDKLPKDINANVMFYVNKHKFQTDYKFIVNHSKAYLIKNGNKLVEAKIISPFKYFTCSHKNNKWKLVVNGEKILSFNDYTKIDNTKIGVGFNGVGKARIRFRRISIKPIEETGTLVKANPLEKDNEIVINKPSIKHGSLEHIVIRIGDYEVTDQEFKDQVDNQISFSNPENQPEIAQYVLDHFLIAGLLIFEAQRCDYDQYPEIKKQLFDYERAVLVETLKQQELDMQKITDRELRACYNRCREQLIIDHFCIPKDNEDVFKEIMEHINSGATTKDISRYKGPIYLRWRQAGFTYEKRVITGGSMVDTLENAAYKLNQNEIKVIKTKSEHHIIRLLQRTKRYRGSFKQEKKNIKQRLALAKLKETGGTLIDRLKRENEIKINKKIVSILDFSVKPLPHQIISVDSLKITDNHVVASVFGKKITVGKLRSKILRLPANVQKLFRHNGTRLKAVTTLLLMDSGVKPGTKRIRMLNAQKERLMVEKLLKIEILDKMTIGVSDASENSLSAKKTYIKQKDELIEWLEQLSANKDDYYINNLLINEAYRRQLDKDKEICNTMNKFGKKQTLVQLEKVEKDITYPWLYPEIFDNLDSLQIDFGVLNKMNIPNPQALDKDKVLARCGSWILRIGEFLEELNNLTPETRKLLAKEKNRSKFIEYLVKKGNHKKGNRTKLTINSKVLENIDIVGDFNTDYLNENAVAASFGPICFTVEQLREKISQMPVEKRIKFENKLKRLKAIEELLIQEVWLKEAKQKGLQNSIAVRRKVKEKKQWLMVQKFYEDKISDKPVTLPDRNMDKLLRMAVKEITEKKLQVLLHRVANNVEIYMNKEALKKLGVGDEVLEQID